jgi:hypothetical protein
MVALYLTKFLAQETQQDVTILLNSSLSSNSPDFISQFLIKSKRLIAKQN